MQVWRPGSPAGVGRWRTRAAWGRHLAHWLVARGEWVEDVRVPPLPGFELSRGGRRKTDVIDAAATAGVAALAGDARPVAGEDLSSALGLLDEQRANLVAHRTRLITNGMRCCVTSCPVAPTPT